MNRKARFVDVYATYGLTENPFVVSALGADERGSRLLVGRDREIDLVGQRLHKHLKITCLDGHVGVGKTSLANVAAYECFQAFLRGETTQLLIPMHESFQLLKDQDPNDFCANVFRRVAQALIRHREHLAAYDGGQAMADRLSPWLNSPIVEHVSLSLGLNASLGIPGGGPSAGIRAGGSTATQLNTSSGFAEQGLEALVRSWLDQIFSVQGNGGVICVIDNLELLETANAAKRALEALRDRIFNVNGLRWVFCGANGVIHSLAASPRLGSFLNTPIIDVTNVRSDSIEPLFRARLNEFSSDPDAAEKRLPLHIDDLKYLYLVLNFNLRDTLAKADEFCEHMNSANANLVTATDKHRRFAKWLDGLTTHAYVNLQSRLPTAAWSILDYAMSDECKGTFGVGNYEDFNSSNKQTVSRVKFDKWLKDMMRLDLLTKNIDDEAPADGSFKRDVFNVTAKGALVHYARLKKHETQTLKETTWLRRVHAD